MSRRRKKGGVTIWLLNFSQHILTFFPKFSKILKKVVFDVFKICLRAAQSFLAIFVVFGFSLDILENHSVRKHTKLSSDTNHIFNMITVCCLSILLYVPTFEESDGVFLLDVVFSSDKN